LLTLLPTPIASYFLVKLLNQLILLQTLIAAPESIMNESLWLYFGIVLTAVLAMVVHTKVFDEADGEAVGLDSSMTSCSFAARRPFDEISC
jgi:hypothetical protein